jgi:hypothetical protein
MSATFQKQLNHEDNLRLLRAGSNTELFIIFFRYRID